ncbi:MAG TPA: hypothetical protein VH143_09490 [Kofleriaceae bacterium]|nr:hypothetical protein [Kofleriaceae bacterium]
MRAIVVLMLALAGAAHADPCVTVTAADAADAAIVKRAVLAAIPATPRSCLDIAVTTTVKAADDIALTTSVRVVISDEHGRMTSVVSGGATAHVAKTSPKLPLYRRDALEQAVTGIAPTIRAHLITPVRRPTS